MRRLNVRRKILCRTHNREFVRRARDGKEFPFGRPFGNRSVGREAHDRIRFLEPPKFKFVPGCHEESAIPRSPCVRPRAPAAAWNPESAMKKIPGSRAAGSRYNQAQPPRNPRLSRTELPQRSKPAIAEETGRS